MGRKQPRPGAGWSWLRRLAVATEAAVAEAVVAEEVNGGGARKRRLAVAEVVVDREAVSRKSPAMGGCLL